MDLMKQQQLPLSPVDQKFLDELKELIKDCDDKHLKAMIDEDDFLMTFIVGRKYDVPYAFKTAKNHMESRNGKYKHIYDMSPDAVRHVLESGFFGVLKNRDHFGRLVGYIRIPKLNIQTTEFDDLMGGAVQLVQKYWYDRGAIENGQVFIIDYSQYSLAIFSKYTMRQKLNFVMLFMNNYPTKIKEVHIFNHPRIFSYTYQFIKPFLPEKLKNRIFLHSYNRENLLEYFSPDILPTFMGGSLSEEEAIDFEIINSILKGKHTTKNN